MSLNSRLTAARRQGLCRYRTDMPIATLTLVSIALTLTAPPTTAPTASDAPPTEAGFVAIFNGRDLTGWTGDTAGYAVESGVITCGPKGSDLYTVNDFANFVLRFQFKLSPGANNGIAIRAPGSGDAAYDGMEIQVLDDGHEKYKGWLKAWQHHGSVYGIAASKGSTAALKPVESWNDEEIVVNDRQVKVTLNGVVILETDLDAAMKSGTLSGKEHPGARRSSGKIGFLGHGDRVSYRALRVQALPAAASNAAPALPRPATATPPPPALSPTPATPPTPSPASSATPTLSPALTAAPNSHCA